MKIIIDSEKETIPIIYSKFKGVSKQVVNNWINRDNKLKTRYIKSLDLVLIKIPIDEQKDFKKFLEDYL